MVEQKSSNPSLSIEKITFNDGTTMEFQNDDIVLLVGANNVGKSRALKDIKENLIDLSENKVIINKVVYKSSNFYQDNLKEFFEKNYSKDHWGNYNVWIDNNQSYSYNDVSFKSIMDERQFYKVMFSFLSTENRLRITRPIAFNLVVDNRSLSVMKSLERDSEAIDTLNRMLNKGFEKSIETFEDYIDGTVVKKYKIGKSANIIDAIQLNRRDSLNALKKMEDLHDQGDGIRSAIAILASLIVNDKSLFLIDEPETFMHPPQARLLGKNIVSLSKQKQCFISTHSIDFIKGVLETGSSRVKIIKIDRSENKNKLNINYSVIADIDLINNADDLKQLVNSIKNDCYNKIESTHNKFITEFEEGMNSSVKTQETIKNEINQLFNKEKYLPESTAKKIKNLLKDISSFKLLKDGGKSILPQGECITLFNQINDFLKEHNIFILECGEIERFVPEIDGHGNTWVEKTFNKYQDINDHAYDEARQFIKSVFHIDGEESFKNL